MQKKINISLDSELVERIESFADENYMSRSGFISFACSQYLASVEMVTCIKKLSLAFDKIASSGSVSDEVMQELEDYQRMANLLVKGR